MAQKTQETKPEQQPICNLEAEQSVLGAILVRPEVLDEVADLLRPEDFYRQDHAQIYRAVLDLYGRRDPVELKTVTFLLKEWGQLEGVGGPEFLAGLCDEVGFATNAGYYAKLVHDKALLRRLKTSLVEAAIACHEPHDDVAGFLDSCETRIFQVMEDRQIQAQPLSELVPPEKARIESLYDRTSEILGVPSGFIDIDRLTCGFQKSDLIIIAARPSMGKTALALNIAYHAAHKAGVPVAFFSLEMSKEQLVQRLMASEGKINSHRLRSGQMEPEEWVALNQVEELLMKAPIYISDKPSPTPMEIRAQARRLKSRHGIGLIIVDYLQLAQDPRAKSREQEIGGISRALKALAKELDVPVIVLSQLNREVEKRPNKRPILADLRDSGQIEQDADLVLFIYRDEVYWEGSPDKGIAEVWLAKQRNGPIGLVKLTYLEEFMRFENSFDDHPQD
jgi:replicative DNA helicase